MFWKSGQVAICLLSVEGLGKQFSIDWTHHTTWTFARLQHHPPVSHTTQTQNMSTTQQRPYYHEDVDFTALAAEDEDFAVVLRQNDGRIDWQDPSAIQ
jgi:hypothetical protein